jgi:hypothetical protein
MEQSPSLEAGIMLSQSRSSAAVMEEEGSLPCSQDLPLVHILSQMNPLHTYFSNFTCDIQLYLQLDYFYFCH